MIEQQQKAVLITGGAARVGRVIALHLARLGWNVAIQYNHSADEAAATVGELKTEGVNAVALQADLMRDDVLASLPEQAAGSLGMPIIALVNNAAAIGKDSIRNFSRESWLRHIETNLYAPLRLISAFVAQLPADREGAVVNLTDGCEGMSLSSQFFTYSLSKYGLAEATRLLAQDLAPHIRVNAVAPGLTLPKEGEEAMFERLIARLPLQRPSEPEDIAQAVAYLLSAPSVTGQVLAVNGGARMK